MTHSSGAIGEFLLRLTSRSPAPPMLCSNSCNRPAVQLTPKPAMPPPCSRKNATTGKREEQARVEALRRQPRQQQRQQQRGTEPIGQVDAPALGFRIEAIDQLRQLGLNIGPAGADLVPGLFGEARGTILAGPHRVNQQEFDRRDHDVPSQQEPEDREQNIARRIQQPRSQEADEAGALRRRRAFGDQVLPDKRGGDIGHAVMLRLMRQP